MARWQQVVYIQHHRQALAWDDDPACHVKHQLAHSDAHAVAAQVPQAKDVFPICHHHSKQDRGSAPAVVLLWMPTCLSQCGPLSPRLPFKGWWLLQAQWRKPICHHPSEKPRLPCTRIWVQILSSPETWRPCSDSLSLCQAFLCVADRWVSQA